MWPYFCTTVASRLCVRRQDPAAATLGGTPGIENWRNARPVLSDTLPVMPVMRPSRIETTNGRPLGRYSFLPSAWNSCAQENRPRIQLSQQVDPT
eukprot:362906-Chlamydomonas_euryale.AAC.4